MNSITSLFHALDIGRLSAPASYDQPKSVIRSSAAKIKVAYSSGTASKLDRWSSARLAKHASGREVYFYSSDASKTAGLICIDIDGDDLDESLAFAHYIQKTFFPTLYSEPSTGGSGVHAYLIVDWGLIPRAQIMQRLQAFERWLDATAREEGFGVRQVEIAGTPTQIFWGADRGEINAIKFGQLAKVPRNIAACESTTRLKLRDLDQIIRENPIERDGSTAPKRKTRGSVIGKHITRAAIEGNSRTAQAIVEDFAPKAKGNARNITVEHVAAWLTIQEFFAAQPNSDGTNPTARMRALWDACYDEGTIKVKYVPAINAAIRNALSDADLIDWQSEHYQPGPLLQIHRPDADRVKGVSMKWSLSESAISNYRSIVQLVADPSISIEPNPTCLGVISRMASGSIEGHSSKGGNLEDSGSPAPAHHLPIRPIRANGLIGSAPNPPPMVRAG